MVYVVSAVRRTLRRWVIRGLSRTHLTVHLVTKGRVLGSVAGMPVLLLTTTGRRSGKARTTPLTFFRDGADLVVIASNGGADRSPDWWLNLQQTPRAVVGTGTDTFVATARAASEQERERLWAVVTATYTGYARYQDRTSRRIPVVLLTPEGPPVTRSTKRRLARRPRRWAALRRAERYDCRRLAAVQGKGGVSARAATRRRS
jgi:deazaflavin-dependent oxidoreductase (nitroreductase family)